MLFGPELQIVPDKCMSLTIKAIFYASALQIQSRPGRGDYIRDLSLGRYYLKILK